MAQPTIAEHADMLLYALGFAVAGLQGAGVYLWRRQVGQLDKLTELLVGEKGMVVRLSVLERDHERMLGQHCRYGDNEPRGHKRQEDL
jgi:hypothetical protein